MIKDVFLEHVKEVLGETEKGLSGTEIVREFTKYSSLYDVEIPFNDVAQQSNYPNKRTALLENLKCFDSNNQYAIISNLCELPKFQGNKDAMELKEKLVKDYSHLNPDENLLNQQLIEKTLSHLVKYPESLKAYKKSLELYSEKKFDRNCLDNMRFSLEQLLKEKFSNNKSLENQKAILGDFLKDQGLPNEFRNMFMKLVEYYAKYQNDHVKHNDQVHKVEIEMVMDFSSMIIKIVAQS